MKGIDKIYHLVAGLHHKPNIRIYQSSFRISFSDYCGCRKGNLRQKN